MSQPAECPKMPVPPQRGFNDPQPVPLPCSMVTVETGATYIRMLDQCSRCGWVDPAGLDRWAQNAHSELMDGTQQRIAMASNLHPFSFVVQTGIPLTLPEAISQAMAAAALAWSKPESAGGYDAERAKQIGRELARFIREGDLR